MARGIITKKPGGGSPNGRIIVTDPNSGLNTGGLSAGGSDVVGADMPVDLGQDVPYTESCSSNEGDVVDFNYDGKEASGLVTAFKATVITGTYQPDITVNKDQAVLLNAATLNGVLITVNGGSIAVVNNTVIKGRISSAIDGSNIVISDGTQINGNFDISGASSFVLQNSTSQGSLTSNGNLYASVTGCTIKGQLTVTNAKVCRCSGNTVSGGTNTPGCTA
jgi:hypothetical protein